MNLAKTADFNSHAHVERDYRFSTLALYHANFNSHAHVERDQTKTENLELKKNFNSHAHVERDLTLRTLNNFILIFQLTRSRGA